MDNLLYLNIDWLNKYVSHKRALVAVACHLSLQGLNYVPLQLLTSNTPWRNSRLESRNEALGTLGTLQDRSLDGQYSQELILWAQFLYILISRKALKSFMVTIVSGVSHEAEASWDQQKFSTKKICVWLHVFPLCQNHICTVLSPLPLWNSLSEFTEVLSSGLQSLFCPKWNLTRNSHIVQFF